MTAVLQQGDKIHLAFPVSTGADAIAAESMARQLIRAYAQMDVMVIQWTSSTTLTHPVVVAIFR